jgi:hypothetical protein
VTSLKNRWSDFSVPDQCGEARQSRFLATSEIALQFIPRDPECQA